MSDDMSTAFARVAALASALPETSQSTSYGTPSLKVRDKTFCRMKDVETLVLMCPLEEKEMLLAAAPDIYFETQHYHGWLALLARLPVISDDELTFRLRRAWLGKAPKRLASSLGPDTN
jgi:hypothetical protein